MKFIPTEHNGSNTNIGCYSESMTSKSYVWVQVTFEDLKLLEKIKKKRGSSYKRPQKQVRHNKRKRM